MLDDIFGWLVLLAVVFWCLPIILAFVAYNKAGRLGSQLAALRIRFEKLEVQEAVPEASKPDMPPIAEPSAEEVSLVHSIAAPQPSAPAPAPGSPRVLAKPNIEEKLTSRWLLWLGAVAIALSGLFLIRYAVENGLLSPAMRIALGFVLGVALTSAGEWVRRRPLQRQIAALRPDYVPGALTSAGLFIAFASIYGAHALYGLIDPAVAFLGLAVVALCAFALGALHSPIVAVLGLLAGYATPLLISSNTPSPWALFGYLALIVFASLAVVRFRHWAWLAFGTVAGAALLTVIWIAAGRTPGDNLPIALFLMAQSAAAIALAELETPPDASGILSGKPGQPELCAWMACGLSAVLLGVALGTTVPDPFALPILGLVFIAATVAGRRWQRFDLLIVFATIPILFVFAHWPLYESLMLAHQQVAGISGPKFEGLIATAVVFHFRHALIFASLIVFAGYAAAWKAKHPQVFAAGSVIGASALLALVYWQLRDVTADLLWACVSVGAAGLALAATASWNGRRSPYEARLTLGVYAAAVTAAVSFTCAFIFREAWLTVALALELPALAWLEDKLNLRELRSFAVTMATVILMRLALNPYVLDYDSIAPLGSEWVLYGYGIPALAFYGASRIFKRTREDRAVTVTEAGALLFALLLLSFEIRILVEGSIRAPHLTFFEMSLNTLIWLCVGWWRGTAYAKTGRAVDGWYAAILIGLAVAGIFAFQLLLLNPVASGESIGSLPILNKLLLGFLIPAVILVLLAGDLGKLDVAKPLRMPAGIGALVLLFVWVTLETKHAFQGPVLVFQTVSDGEYYAYSAVWLLSALALLGIGLLSRRPDLRYGALGILLVTVLKVFLSDMSGLEGLYRVASFLGLGLVLVVIGWVYQRFVFPAALPPSSSPT